MNIGQAFKEKGEIKPLIISRDGAANNGATKGVPWRAFWVEHGVLWMAKWLSVYIHGR